MTTPTSYETTLAVDTKKASRLFFVRLELKCEFGLAPVAFEGLVTTPVVDQWVTETIPYSEAKTVSKPAFKLNNRYQAQNIRFYGDLPATEAFRRIDEKERGVCLDE